MEKVLELRELMATTDRVSEIQNTLRQGVAVTLTRMEVEQVGTSP